MIVRSMPAGHSFKWLATYLTTDPKAQTAERVAFTYTLNLAFDDVKSAVDTMLHTYRDRDLLKSEAGVRRGGSSVEKPVKHVSLAWHASERPTQAMMIAAATSYLKKMGWQDHECLVVGHTDRKHPHIHLMINVIHPERGTRLDDRYERRRAQAWALEHEKSLGQIWCAERLKPIAERAPSPPRNVWEQLKAIGALSPDAAYAPGQPLDVDYDAHPRQWRGQEWQHLKLQQMRERIAFFEGGKAAYREARTQVYRDVRAEYRQEWADLYALRRSGASNAMIAEVRAAIAERQGKSLAEKAQEAAHGLRIARDDAYRGLLDRQKATRGELIDRQEVGLGSPHLIQPAPDAAPPAPIREAAEPRNCIPLPTELSWTSRAGMVAQQRAANSWLDRAVTRLAQAPPAQQSPSRSRLAAAQDRLEEKTPRQERRVKEAGIEPDR